MNYAKKACAYLMSLVILIGTFVPIQIIQAADAPQGIANSWAQPYLQKMYTYGIMRGDQEGNMDPNRAITRAEFASAINRAFGYNSLSSEPVPFKDIKGTEWYADDIKIAYQQGYYAGTAATTAGATDTLTREQAVTMLCRNLKLEQPVGEVLGFADSREFSQWSKGAISAFTERGYISGYEDDTFRPNSPITRGEVAKIMTDIVGYRISEGATYQPGVVQGNVMITCTGVSLENTTITGDLYITAGVGIGYANLRNVTVLGDVIISGGGASEAGENSINFIGCQINTLILDGQEDNVLAVDSYGTTVIQKTLVKTNAYLENYGNDSQGFVDIEVVGVPETRLSVSGDFNQITVKNPKNYLVVGKGTVNHVVMDEGATESTLTIDKNASVDQVSLDVPCIVDGLGDIGHLIVNAPDTESTIKPDTITIRPGLVATIGGKEWTSSDAAEYSADPRILAGYPKADEISSETVSMLYQTNKSGTLYWAVTFSEDSGLLDTKDIMDPVKSEHAPDILTYGSSGVKTAETDIRSAINKLSAEMSYTVAAVLLDERGEISNIKEKDFETVDDSIPAFSTGYPNVSSKENGQFNIGILPTKNCQVYWAIFEKGSVAPTALELRKGQLNGEILYGVEDGQKNIEDIIDARSSDLKEKETYDIYVMASDGVRDSKVIKLTGTVKDSTPPNFISGYPKEDERGITNVNVIGRVDENSTIYYAVVKMGQTLLPLDENGQEPALNSDELKQAVVTGNTAYKKGNKAATEGDDAVINITGLEKEKAYWVYMVAKDASGNISDVKIISIKTLDVTPPTASLEFGEEENGKLKVGSSLTIVFNEIVVNRTYNKEFTAEGLLDTKEGSDQHCFELYRLDTGNASIPVEIDWSGVSVGLTEDGGTYITIPKTDEFLYIGETYVLKLQNIADTSNNKMQDGTELKFSTVPPLVDLQEVLDTEDLDLVFSINPLEQATEDALVFDIIFKSNIGVEFDIYKKDDTTNGQFEKLTGIKQGDYSPRVEDNGEISLRYILDKEMAEAGEDGKLPYKFEIFNDIKPTQYGIKFKKIGGMTEVQGWNQTVKMEIKCVVGSQRALETLASSPSTQWDNAEDMGALLVNKQQPFTMNITFTDTIIPQYMEGYPMLEVGQEGTQDYISYVGDTIVTPHIRTTKPATVYYLVVEGIGDKATAVVEDPWVLINGTYPKPDGHVFGTYVVESADTEYVLNITGLKPETDYTMYSCLKGAPNEPSDVEVTPFRTTELKPPIITNAQIMDREETSVFAQITTDRRADVYWVVMLESEAEKYLDENGQIKEDSVELLKETIFNAKEVTDVIPDFGKSTTTYLQDENVWQIEEKAENLDRAFSYVIFAVARARLDDGTVVTENSSDIAIIDGIVPTDTTPPNIEVYYSSDYDEDTETYSGAITLMFSEDTYYKEGGKINALTKEEFFKSLVPNRCTISDTKNISYTTYPMNENGVRPLRSIVIYYKDATDGSIIFYDRELCDKAGNTLGTLVLEANEVTVDTETEIKEIELQWVAHYQIANE